MVKVKGKISKVENTEDIIDYGFGDLYIICSCGHEERLAEGLEGIRIEDLPANNRASFALACNACKTILKLYFKPSDNVDRLRAEKEVEVERESVKLKEEYEGTKVSDGVD